MIKNGNHPWSMWPCSLPRIIHQQESEFHEPCRFLDVQRSETYSGSCRSCKREVCMVAGMLEGNGCSYRQCSASYCTYACRRAHHVPRLGKDIFSRVLTCLDITYTHWIFVFCSRAPECLQKVLWPSANCPTQGTFAAMAQMINTDCQVVPEDVEMVREGSGPGRQSDIHPRVWRPRLEQV
jgi:hypothetical protein